MVTKKSISDWLNFKKENPKSIGFVPTMGALHKGHLSLIEKSLSENDITLLSVFLNPTQFNNSKDLDKYPSNIVKDIELINEKFKDQVFLITPQFKDIYPDNYKYKVTEKEFSKKLCGHSRPGHFDGVLTVVMKLLNISGAKKAYFGEKDYQQLKLIKEMVAAFFIDTKIIEVKTTRDESGLALSSRNQRLSSEAIKIAPNFYKILSSNNQISQVKKELKEQGFELDYIEDFDNRRYGAVFLEDIRLIDNISLSEVDK
jgi:pantoate--beta-alanine ligase